MIRGSIQQEDITILNIHAANVGASKYIKQILTNIKGEIDSNTIIITLTIIIITFIAHLNQWTDYPDRKSIREHWP